MIWDFLLTDLWLQTDFYEVADAESQGQRLENVFSTRSNVFHGKYMKPYQKYFNIGTILGKEHLLDNMIRSLCEQLETRFVDGRNAGKTAELADWIEYSEPASFSQVVQCQLIPS